MGRAPHNWQSTSCIQTSARHSPQLKMQYINARRSQPCISGNRLPSKKTIFTSWFGLSLTLVSFLCLVSTKIPLYRWSVYGHDYCSDTLARYLYDTSGLEELTFEATPLDTTLRFPGPTLSKSNGRTEQVCWDNYSLMLLGQRIFLQ